MPETSYILWVTLVMALATFATRILPFVFFHRQAGHPMMDYVARYTPPMIMSVLLVYVLKDVDFVATQGLHTLIAVLLTIGLHLWRSNPMLSIFGGTFLYMFLVQ